jgi:hypothetical protein
LSKSSIQQYPSTTRTRKRGIQSSASSEAEDQDRESQDDRKRQRTTTASYQDETIELLRIAVQGQENPIAKAIQLLKTEYQARLSIYTYDNAIEELTDKKKATVFINLDGKARDRWLIKHIQALELQDPFESYK